jgi:hypothetical protein
MLSPGLNSSARHDVLAVTRREEKSHLGFGGADQASELLPHRNGFAQHATRLTGLRAFDG